MDAEEYSRLVSKELGFQHPPPERWRNYIEKLRVQGYDVKNAARTAQKLIDLNNVGVSNDES
jgi:hypothetical protein